MMADESMFLAIACCIHDFSTFGTGPAGISRIAEVDVLMVQGREIDEYVTEITIGPTFSQLLEVQIF